METIPIKNEVINTDLLVIGGGMAGITAAVEAAEVGCNVVLVEREHYLGGRVVQMHQYFPKLCPPICGLEINFRRLRNNPNIIVLTGASPEKVMGEAGNITAEIKIEPRYITEDSTASGEAERACEIEIDDPFNFAMNKAKALRIPHQMAFPMRYLIDSSAVNDPRIRELADKFPDSGIDLDMQPKSVTVNAKSVIYATGWKPYDPENLVELGFGKLPNIISNMMLERIADAGGPTQGKITRPSDQAAINSVAFVQCAGSRDVNHLPYCSAVCCMASLKQSRYIREQYPDAAIHIFFIDVRTPGRWEDFYQDVQDDPKTITHRGKVAKIEQADNGKVTVIAENTLTGDLERVTVDMAVLATGMQPNFDADSPPKGLTPDEFGFLQNNGIDGVYTAGVAAGPKDVAATVEEATGAVIRALKHIKMG